MAVKGGQWGLMRGTFYLLMLITVLTGIILVGLVLMIKKYYWGPAGRPPRYHYRGDEPKRKADEE